MKRQHKNTILIIILLLSVVLHRSSLSTQTTGNDDTSAAPGSTQQDVAYQASTTASQPDDTNQNSQVTARSKILSQQPGHSEYRYRLQPAPNDPSFGSNWAQGTVQVSRAWDMTTGSSGVVVAVIDSGFALNHQDLSGRWLLNTAEQGTTASGDSCWTGVPLSKSTNNCDDDGNGYVDDWRGYDFFNDDNNVQAGLTNPNGDGVDHGTLVAGTIGASANNSMGGAGMDWSARLMPLQIFSDDGEAYTSHVVEAIEYAVDNGADIINLSLGTNAPDGAMLTAVRYARDNGVLVVAASGNCVGSSDSFCTALPDAGRMLYPANFSEVLSVGATTSSDTRASFSGYGPELDMTAPGVNVGPLPTYTSGQPASAYFNASGTSFATPLVAGTAALALAENPSLTRQELIDVLTESSQKVSAMGSAYRTDQLGQGRLNAYRAVLMARALGDVEQVGATSITTDDPPVGYAWRSRSGNVVSDEWVLIGCRVAPAQVCSAVAKGGSTVRYETAIRGKAGEIQFIYISGSSLPSGSSALSVHSNEFAQLVTSVSR